jgi:hypothetical protein
MRTLQMAVHYYHTWKLIMMTHGSELPHGMWQLMISYHMMTDGDIWASDSSPLGIDWAWVEDDYIVKKIIILLILQRCRMS